MNKSTGFQKYILIFSIISFFVVHSIFAQVKGEKQRNYLTFKLLESSQEIGKNIGGNADSLGFTDYSGNQMTDQFPSANRMLTLRSSFKIDSINEQEELVLVFPPVLYPCNIYLNGTLIGYRGDIKNGYTSRNHSTECYFLPPGLLERNSKANEIAIELLPKYGEKNPVTGIFIASRKSGETYVFWRNLFSIDFIKAMFLSSFLFFLYFIIFSFQRKQQTTSYYVPFAMACFFYPIAYLNNIATFDFVDTLLIERITKLGSVFWSYFVLYYILEFTKITRYKNQLLLILAILYIPLLILGWLPGNVREVIDFNLKYTSILHVLVLFTTILICVIYTIRNRSNEGYILTVVYLLVLPSLLYDMYYFKILYTKPYALTLPYSMFLTLATFFFIISWQQSSIYKLASKQALELKNINENLEKLIVERTVEIRKLSVAVEQSPTTIVITDTKGNIEYANPKFTDLTGYTLKEAIGKNPRILKSGKTDATLFKELWQTISSGKSWKGELINVKKDGNQFIENCFISPIKDANGKITNYVAIKEDITERKHQEELIELRNIELKELNATKDKFFSIIAHDLRGPIGTIDSFLDFILDEEKSNKNADLLENLNILKTSSRQAYTLLENLLTWARVQKGDIPYNPSSYNIKEIITNNFEIFQLKAREKNIALINKVDHDTYCYIDYQMITTVIRNLLNNATKYTNDNGSIEISLIEKEKAIEVTIKDSGVGMDKNTTDHLFYLDNKQISQVGTKGEMGSGLGLILCKEFIEKNGGEIWAESEIGKGSEFKFTLPGKFEDVLKG
ncbi:MAG: PAS domain S-box protein [Mariniphaga sp.]